MNALYPMSAPELPPVVILSGTNPPLAFSAEANVLLLGDAPAPGAEAIHELQQVLHSGERHGVVCARTTVPGTWTSFPLTTVHASNLDGDTAILAHAEMRISLPRYTVVPAAPNWPLLIRGELLHRFDFPAGVLSDPVELSWQLSNYGYSSLVAHHVLLSPPPNAAPAMLTIKRVLEDPTPGHPELATLLRYYIHNDIHPLEHFAALFGQARRPRLLFNFLGLRPTYNGTSEYGLALLNELRDHFADRLEVTILATPEAIRFHGLNRNFHTVLTPIELRGVFDLGFSPTQLLEQDRLLLLNRHCLRIAFTLLDIICIRCGELLARRDRVAQEILRTAIRFSEGITTISEAGQADARAFFGPLFSQPNQIVRPIRLGMAPPKKPLAPMDNLPPPGYVLVMGNAYTHKTVREAVKALASTPQRLVVLGVPPQPDAPAGTTYFLSGQIAPDFIDALYYGCRALVFPSQYEGFGLPVAQALALGKPVILFPTAINLELAHHFSTRPHQAVFCSSFSTLAAVLETALATDTPSIETAPSLRSWAETTGETVQFFEDLLHLPLSAQHIKERWDVCRQIEEIGDARQKRSSPPRQARILTRLVEQGLPAFGWLRRSCPGFYEALAIPYRRHVLRHKPKAKP